MSIRSKVIRELEERPRRLRELKEKLGNDRKVQHVLKELMARGKVELKAGTYYLAGTQAKAVLPQNGIPATIVKVAARFGFAARTDGQGDIFIPGRSLMGAMPGDQVLVQLFEHPRVAGSQEGEVVAVTVATKSFVGTVRQGQDGLFLEPDQCPGLYLFIEPSADGGVRDGDKAAVEILERGTCHADHRVGVAMRFGSAEEARQCAKGLLYAHGMTRHFPDKVKAEAQLLENAVLAPEELAGRLDLRELPIFTIDSASTKDIDDAVSLKETQDGWELGVHIADVSHYVRPDTQLDQEAFKRGTSVYYADKVIPMLPRQLSNGICSLNPQEDRLAFSCLMKLDGEGRLQEHHFAKTVIRSRVKGVYSEINAMLAGQSTPELEEKYSQVAAELPAMQRLYEKRQALRHARSAMDIESGEAVLVLDEEGRCIDVKKAEPGLSEGMIEEMMLLANQCAAETAKKAQLPFVYRVHEAPDEERLERLQTLLNACHVPVTFAAQAPTQRQLAEILDSTRGTSVERAVHTGVLRSMAKAKYDVKPLGHYGLALEDYAHFTSPIRRYADLAVHRILTALLGGQSAEEIQNRYGDYAIQAAQQASGQELAALQVERGAEDCYKAEYLSGHIGEVFSGVVSGVTAHGIYVELPNTVEGMVPVNQLCQGQPVLVDGVRLTDPLRGKSWVLGDEVRVQVARTDVALGRVDMALV